MQGEENAERQRGVSRPNLSEPLRPLLNIITFIAGVRDDWLFLTAAQEIGYTLMEINTATVPRCFPFVDLTLPR